MEDDRFWFEEVPEEWRYWTLVQWGRSQNSPEAPERTLHSVFGSVEDEEAFEEGEEVARRADAVGFAPGAIEPERTSTPPEEKYALVLYSSREAAEAVRRDMEERDPDEYLRLVEVYGQEQIDKAYSNSAPYRAVWTTPELLLNQIDELERAAIYEYGPRFSHVIIDGKEQSLGGFIRELERRIKTRG